MTAGQEDWKYINKYTFADNQKDGCWYSNGEFVGDGKKNLSGANDAATKNWGSQWQMPTRQQFEELINTAYTTSEYTTQNGVNGLKVTGKNGNSIFLPAAGWYESNHLDYEGMYGSYWTSEYYAIPEYRWNAFVFSLGGEGSDQGLYINRRDSGHPVRPVRKK